MSLSSRALYGGGKRIDWSQDGQSDILFPDSPLSPLEGRKIPEKGDTDETKLVTSRKQCAIWSERSDEPVSRTVGAILFVPDKTSHCPLKVGRPLALFPISYSLLYESFPHSAVSDQRRERKSHLLVFPYKFHFTSSTIKWSNDGNSTHTETLLKDFSKHYFLIVALPEQNRVAWIRNQGRSG